jgi:hypothetical protein
VNDDAAADVNAEDWLCATTIADRIIRKAADSMVQLLKREGIFQKLMKGVVVKIMKKENEKVEISLPFYRWF